jgi:A/G-specific adenine glycosylase
MPSTENFSLEGKPIAEPKPPQERDPLAESAAFSSALIDWFRDQGRDYPWRRTRDPYAVLVSEIMLQQTRIATVLSRRYFENWLEKFPDVHSLAHADEADILKAWEGLGYYRRARNLQRAARAVVEDFGGIFPTSAEHIQQLPGVGRYTAGAVASFACGQRAAIVDGNIARVLARIFDYHEIVDSTAGQRQLWEWAHALLPEVEAGSHSDEVRDYNSGLMELGQSFCSKGTPKCQRCPVAGFCATRSPADLPRKKAAARIEAVSEHAAYVCDSDGRVLLEKIPVGQRREGMWRLPALAEPELGKVHAKGLRELSRSRYSITRYRVDLIIYRANTGDLPTITDAVEREWFDLRSIGEAAVPSPYRRALEHLLSLAEPE